MKKSGWISPEGEIIPVIPPKTYESTITEWALNRNITFDKAKNSYISFIELGFIWFLGTSIVTKEELNFVIKRKIENYLGEKISLYNILIYNIEDNQKER